MFSSTGVENLRLVIVRVVYDVYTCSCICLLTWAEVHVCTLTVLLITGTNDEMIRLGRTVL